MSKTILITGASTGIGAETASHLAPGNHLFLHYNSSVQAAQNVAADVERKGGQATMLCADLSHEAGCRQLHTELARKMDRLDVLVNNAGGMLKRHGIRDYEWRLMEDIFALNTFSAMMVTALCIPLLEKGEDPSIITITSLAIRHGGPTATIYAAAKAALDAFTRGMAKELAPGIRVNAVAPGVIATPFHDKVTSPEQIKAWTEATPLKKIGAPGHIASAVKFIIENDFMTGETIDINGGLFMR
jgi:3-oxoacyl-[acyl-carrier protein] reductase